LGETNVHEAFLQSDIKKATQRVAYFIKDGGRDGVDSRPSRPS
jgi:hypothetical protein